MEERPADDALAALRAVLDAPDRRSWRRFLRRPTPEHRRPLVDRLNGATPPAETGAAANRGHGDDHPHHPRWVPLAGVALAVGAAVVVLWVRPAARGDGVVAIPRRQPSTPGGAVDREPTTTAAATRLWPAEPIAVDGREVRTGGHRWEVGTEGDSVTIGDWDCDRQPTPAVLRPATGQVAVFDDWAAPGEERPARTVAVVPNAISVEPDGCGRLTVRTADGGARRFATRPSGS